MRPELVVAEGFSRVTCDVTDDAALRRVIDEVDPQIVINAAAYTSVDAAEDDPESADAVNANAPAMLGALCAQRGLRLVHVSTDFVFDGRAHRPYTPDADPSPLGIYGASKWRGEQAVLASGAGHAVVRTSWVYGPGGRNFVLTMLRLMREQGTVRVVNDQIGSPTSARGLAEICWLLALNDDAGECFTGPIQARSVGTILPVVYTMRPWRWVCSLLLQRLNRFQRMLFRPKHSDPPIACSTVATPAVLST